MNTQLLMPCRWQQLQAVYQGLLKTNLPFIHYSNETFKACSIGDDPGIYYAIPYLAKFTSMSLQDACSLFFQLVCWIPLLYAYIRFFMQAESLLERIYLSISFFAYALSIYSIQDVYLAYSASILITVGALTCPIYKKNVSPFLPSYAYGILGFLYGCLHLVRAYSWLPAASFLFYWIGNTPKKIIKHLTLFVCCMFIPSIYVNMHIKRATAFLKDNAIRYMPAQKHPFWHTVFLSFGFLKQYNPPNIIYNDEYGFEYAKKHMQTIEPYSKEYEAFEIWVFSVIGIFFKHRLWSVGTSPAAWQSKKLHKKIHNIKNIPSPSFL